MTTEILNRALHDRYRVDREIGRGATATVYLAHDVKHDRQVALKVPNPELASILGAKRFLREVTVTAGLDHPHILSLLDSGEADGLLYYVMPYVQGESLRERLTRERQLPLDEALSITREVADALSYAHAQGIIHRDIKPENILLSRGHARVADFGIARALSAGGEALTQTGLAVGTPLYMSPEQASAERELDPRSDIYSLGCVLYEMLAGHPPYTGGTAESIMARKFVGEVPSLRVVRETVPVAVEQAIVRSLAKAPADRFASARQFVDALSQSDLSSPQVMQRRRRTGSRRLVAGALVILALGVAGVVTDAGGIRSRFASSPAADIRSLAVLPLENLSGDANEDYLAAGIHEALIVNLAKLSGLTRVSARASVLRFQQSDKSPRQIAAELGVDALMSGTVLRSGDRVRITAHLIDANTEQPLWSADYERAMHDVLTLQNEIVSVIAREVQLQLSPNERAELARTRRVNPEAYQAYLRGKHQLNAFNPDAFPRALAYFREAIAIDPAEPLAYAALAHAYTLSELFVAEPAMDDVRRAQAAARKALELDESLAEAHAALAYFKYYKEWDYEGADRSFRRALELNPNLAEPHVYYGWYWQSMGDDEAAITHMKRAVQLDPLSPLYTAWVAGLYWVIGRFEEAVVEANKALELAPDFPVALYVKGGALTELRRFDEAIEIYRHGLAAYPTHNFTWVLAWTYARAGRRADTRTLLRPLESGASVSDSRDPYLIATAYMELGDRTAALQWLERAYERRSLYLVSLWRDPNFKALQNDARFLNLLRRVNLTPQGPPHLTSAAPANK